MIPIAATARRSANGVIAIVALTGALLAACAAFALMAPVALASPDQVIADCADDGALSRNYSARDLAAALGSLPADLDEYSDCRGVIEAAFDQAAGGKGKKASDRLARLLSAVGADRATAEDRAALAGELAALTRTRESGEAPAVALDGRNLRPEGGGALRAAGFVGPLPFSLVAALVALALTALAGAAALASQGRLGAPALRLAALIRRRG